MRLLSKLTSILFLYFFTTITWTAPVIEANFFLSSTCSHCQNEDVFFKNLEQQKPWLKINRYVINQDKTSLEKFQQQLKQHNLDDYAVPAVFFCDSWWIGFDKAETTGAAITRGLDYCYEQISKKGHLDYAEKRVLKQWANSGTLAPQLINISSNPLVFIPLAALMDALSSCSIFCLLALFSFLWIYKEKSIMSGLGTIFLVLVAIVHYYQQAHTVVFYLTLSWLRLPAALIGLGLIAYVLSVYSKGRNIHPGFTLPLLAASTALIIEAYQQTCMPNIALIFTHWLDYHQISAIPRMFYIFCYHLIYILPLALFMAFVIYCRVQNKAEKFNTLFLCFSWCLLLIIGLLFIIYPQGLANLPLSLVALFVALAAAWITVRSSKRISRE
ncbi:MAG: hypothetical protein H0U70_01500 [Tatlockia sp.]|nr:hypothetical protein [Tatlockia sp.]